jgi:poly(hydroxyalkanoate) granule-associated protein
MPTKTKVEEVEELDEREPNPLVDAVRKVLLAGIGAVALAQEEIEDLIDRLVERGEIAENDGRKLIKEILDQRKKKTQKAEDELNKRVEIVLERMNIPSKVDIDQLSEKISNLSKKIDELKKP